MAYSTSTLLGLPRELRDMIYSSLTQRIDLEWSRTHPELCDVHDLRIDDAPIRSMLLVHPQLYTEYLATCFKRVYISVWTNFSPKNISWVKRDNPPHISTINPRNESVVGVPIGILSHFRSIAIIRCIGHKWPGALCHGWISIRNCANELLSLAPSLASIRIMVEGPREKILSYDTLSRWLHENRAAARTEFLSPPSNALARSPLVQRCEGFFVNEVYSMWPYDVSPALFYTVKIGLYLFTRNAQPESFWRADDAVNGYLRDDRELSKESRKKLFVGNAWLLDDPSRVQEWKEKRGAALDAWDSERCDEQVAVVKSA